MISKENFIEIINRLQKADEFVQEVNDKARKLRENINMDFFDGNSLFISHDAIVIMLLDNMFNTDLIDWWCYELDFGKKYIDGCIQESNGNNIDVSTVEKLYNYLIEDMKDEE